MKNVFGFNSLKIRFYCIILTLILTSIQYSFAVLDTFNLSTRILYQKAYLFYGANNNDREVGGYKRGSSNQQYSYEVMNFHDITSVSGSISQVKYQYKVDNFQTWSGNRLKSHLYEQNKGNFSATAKYDTYNFTSGWNNDLGSSNSDSNGWKTIQSSKLKKLVQDWVDTPSKNQGLILAGNFENYQLSFTISDARIIIDYNPYFKPIIDIQPDNIDANENDEITFRVTAHGNPESLNYQWQRLAGSTWNNTGSNSKTFNISNIKLSNAANYRVRISNNQGAITSNKVALTVCELPNISNHPTNQKINEGEDVTFSITANAGLSRTYQWQYSTDNWNTSHDVSGATNSNYLLTNVQGSYNNRQIRCVVSACDIDSISKPATLTVLMKAGITSISPTEDLKIKTGNNLALSGIFTGTTPHLIRWIKQKKTGWDTIATTTNYNIVNADSSTHSGNYRVRIVNVNSDTISDTITLIVYDPPVFTLMPINDTATEGESASFTVTATGSLPLTYVWQKNMGQGWTNITGETSNTLSILGISRTDDGNFYRCITESNGTNTTSDSALLTVHYKVSISALSPASPHSVNVGNNLIFDVTAEGSPAPSYEWQKQIDTTWKTIVNANKNIYKINTIAIVNDGIYRVRVWNEKFDTLSEDITIRVYDKPVIISHPENTMSLTDLSATLKVVATGSHLTYQWQVKSSGTFSDIPQGTNDTLVLNATQSIDGNKYQCVVNSGTFSTITNTALFTLGKTPIITTEFHSDTMVRTNDSLSLTIQSNAVPAPKYEWFMIPNNSTSAISIALENNITIRNIAKKDSASIYCIVRNIYDTISSDTMFVNVMDPVAININLPNYNSVVHGGTALFVPGVTGDGNISYTWYKNNTIMPNDTNPILSIPNIDSIQHNGTIYHCAIQNKFSNIVIGSATTTQCTLVVSKFYNPFRVKVEQIDNQIFTKVRVKVWSDIDISDFPDTESTAPWADSLWLLYKTNGYPQNESGAIALQIPISTIKSLSPDTLEKTISIDLPKSPHDSLLYFSYALKWHTQNPKDSLVKPFTQSNNIFIIDTFPPQNPLVLHGVYITKTDTLKIIIDSLQKLNVDNDSLVTLDISYSEQFNVLISQDTLSIKTLLAAEKTKDTLIVTGFGEFPIETKPIYCKWNIIGTNSAIGSYDKAAFSVGWERPEYKGRLNADTTNNPVKIQVSWDAPEHNIDSLRIWWNTDTIPLSHAINLPENQSKTIAYASLDIDTIDGLSDSCNYFFGLQIYQDYFWSSVTEKSRTSIFTTTGDTNQISNVSVIDSIWFDNLTNTMGLTWKIDLTTLPDNKDHYQIAYQASIDSLSVQTTVPEIWFDVMSPESTITLLFDNGIMFDTTYFVGLWIRAINSSGKPTQATPPTKQSFNTIKTPPFTWEIFNFFIGNDSVVQLLGGKILVKKIVPFTIADTLKLDTLPPLPHGLVDIGTPCFTFHPLNDVIAPFLLGIKYSNLPENVFNSDIGLYQIVNGTFQMRYSFTKSNGIVWDTLRNKDMENSFVLLADTTNPVISIGNNCDTIFKKQTIPLNISISDNISNVSWSLHYGPGNVGYQFSDSGFTCNYLDTIKTAILDTNYVIHPSFGTRVIFITNDGVHRDTINISKSVYSENIEYANVSKQKWLPLQTFRSLDEPSLEKIFTISIPEEEQGSWKYDILKFRLYRWCQTNNNRSNWLEYNDKVKSQFTFEPGRLIWCKSVEDATISYGSGITTSLKKNFEIELKPGDWTDFTLPFEFPVLLKDVLIASGSASQNIGFYSWVPTLTAYEATQLFISKFDDINAVSDTLSSQYKHNAYTVYNYSSKPQTLQIPPVCLDLSINHTYSTRTIKNNDKWDISFRWCEVESTKNQMYRNIRCGFDKMVSENDFGSLPPSMSKLRIGVIDSTQKTPAGWQIQHDLTQGGLIYEICMQDNMQEHTSIEYYLDNLSELPQNLSAKILHPETMVYEECTSDNTGLCTLQSDSKRYVIIGTDDFFDNVISWLTQLKFTFLKSFPNPFTSIIKIQYQLPRSIKEVRFTLYDIRGRKLWHGIEKNNLKRGINTFLFDSKKSYHGVLPAGLYIIKLSALNKNGKIIYGGKKKIFCIK